MTQLLERPAAGTPDTGSVDAPSAPPATPATPPPAHGHEGHRKPKVRDGFLDTVRAIALIRVIIWHTLAWASISWFVASMPAMFFVAGSLLARSIDKRPWKQLLKTRLRRLLLPFWTFGAVVLTVLGLVHHFSGTADTAISPVKLLAWLVPLADPHGSAWEAGWASTPLWYLRCYLWLLLLSPLLRRAHRRFGLKVLLAPLVGIVVVDFLIRNPDLAPSAFTAVKYYAWSPSASSGCSGSATPTVR